MRESRVAGSLSSTNARPTPSGGGKLHYFGGGIALTRFATCACGQLAAACTGEPTNVSLCHCLACQKRTGSTYGVAAFFRRSDVESKGRTKHYTRPSDSGHDVTFHFCP